MHAPLSDKIRTALLSLLRMRWPGVQSELEPEDWEVYQRIRTGTHNRRVLGSSLGSATNII